MCIIGLLIDLTVTHLSNQAKHNIIIVAVIIGIFIVLLAFFKIYCKFNQKYTLKQLDAMDGYCFEYACADILKSNGFKHIEVTKSSGDFGVDIIAEKDKIKYAIQCKCYSHKLDNTPVQEVIGGLAYYGCTKGAVMTNQCFTEPAKQLARVNDVELWDRDVLSGMLNRTSKDSSNKTELFRTYLTDTSSKLVAYLEEHDILSRIEKIHTDNTILSFTLRLKIADDIDNVKSMKPDISKVIRTRVIEISQDNEYDTVAIIAELPRKFKIK